MSRTELSAQTMAGTRPAIVRLGQGSRPGLEDHEPANAFKSAQNSA